MLQTLVTGWTDDIQIVRADIITITEPQRNVEEKKVVLQTSPVKVIAKNWKKTGKNWKNLEKTGKNWEKLEKTR